MIERLFPDDIREVHDQMLDRFGGLVGEYQPGLIDYMADKPFDGFGDMEYYPGLFMKAAVYMEGFATMQYFCDGNKRTAYGCAALFLRLNGYILIVNDEELYHITKAVANKDLTVEDLAEWFERNTQKIEDTE